MSFTLCDNDARALGKILDMLSPEELVEMGMEPMTVIRAEWIFEDLDKHLSRVFGRNWDAPGEGDTLPTMGKAVGV